MSLINQVLSDLEKRGVNALPGGASIRVVPVQRNRLKLAWLAVAVLALMFMAGKLWLSSSQPETATPVSVRQAPAIRPVAAAQAASQPVVALAVQQARQQDSVAEESGQKTGVEVAGSAMHMSFELSSIPLPSSLRAKPVGVAAGQHSVSSRPASPPIPAAPASDTPKVRSAPHATESKAPATALASAAFPANGAGKQVSVQQQADNEFRKAGGLLQQGHADEAMAGYKAALRLDAGHDEARQALVGLLLENKRSTDAESVLQDGLAHNPRHSGFAMLLARLQVERDAIPLALDTLLKTLPYADQQPDYQAFVAALLQRQDRHKEAITHYQIALQLSPNSGVWLMGLGISLQSLQRNEEARDAFKRALESRALSDELQAFVRQRLQEL